MAEATWEKVFLFLAPVLSIPVWPSYRLDHEERMRKRIARESHKQSESAQKLTGLRAKLYQKKRHAEKIQMRKQIRAHEQRNLKSSAPTEPSSIPLPQYLLDRTHPTGAKALSTAIKNKRAEKAAKFSVPLPKVRGIAEEEMFKVVKTGKKIAKKGWKRMITKPTFGKISKLRTPWYYSLLFRKTIRSLHPDRWLVSTFGSNTFTSTDLWFFFSRSRFYTTPCEIWALYPPHGPTLQEGQRDASWARCDSTASHY